MKKLILEYLANFISRWDAANNERRVKLTYEYKAFCGAYNLPNLCASDLEHEIKNEQVVIMDFIEGEEQEDLFEQLDTLPMEVQGILADFGGQTGYVALDNLLDKLKPHGYTFEYGLDAQPYNLRKIEQKKALKTPTELKEKWMNKLEESKTQPRKFQPHDSALDFVEEYYPNYSSADNICRALDLFLKKEQNGDTLNDEEDMELAYIMEDVYQTAINAFIQSQNK